MESKHGKSNRLMHEQSPYLQQHAYNPVDWYPWGEEAFTKARQERKPIFLSIGYSTCHWCHVMERESFENDEVAAVLNEHFVAIKVDREERPDLDKIYMAATQATTGSGGWPMSVWLTGDLKPFYCGTYFPPDSRYGRPGFKDLLLKIQDVWEANHAGILDQANRITESLTQFVTVARAGDGALDLSPLHLCHQQLEGSFDSVHGGFGGAPKFPRPVALNFLFQTGHPEMALHTLRKMGEGGMFDHLGGGFHRYSVDDRWLVSHFEKMLYDQAQLVSSYIDAYQVTGDEFFADVARRTCDYVLRDMTSPDGGFYSAEDADSEGVEGKFYVWTQREIEESLGEDAAAFCASYDVMKEGNWEHGLNILHGNGHPIERGKLLEIRGKRIRPHRDEKVITAWNGLMISALCRAAQTLEETRYLQAAQRAAKRFEKVVRSGKVPAVVDDYAFLTNGLVDLYETDFDPVWLARATALAEEMLRLFYDPVDGGFFMNSGQDASVILRTKEEYDGAEPSGNSVATLALLRLAELVERNEFRDAAERTLRLFMPRMRSAPHVMPQMLCALDFFLGQPKQITVTGAPDATMLRVIRRRYLPGKTVRHQPSSGETTVTVCVDRVCQLPARTAGELEQRLE